MKKARYAFAAVGAAPALGLLAPAATTAPAITHAQARPAKTVRLSHATILARHVGTSSPAPSPQYVCHPWNTRSYGYSTRHNFFFSIRHYGRCVNSQWAELDVEERGVSERIRAYSQYGQMIFWTRLRGELVNYSSVTAFPRDSCGPAACNPHYAPLNWNPVYTICAALVVDNTNMVLYGPVCLNP